MGTFLPVAYDFVTRKRFRFDGGYIRFEKQGGDAGPILFIDTTRLDVSMFVKREGSPTRFSLTARFLNGGETELWSDTILPEEVGFTVPKTVFRLNEAKSVSSLVLQASTQDHYFILWNGGGLLIGSSFQTPEVYVSATSLSFSYHTEDVPVVVQPMDIRSTLPISATGELSWTISSEATRVTPIPGIVVEIVSPTSIQLVLTEPIYFNERIFITATNSKRISSQASFRLHAASEPVIQNPGAIRISRLPTSSSSIPLRLSSIGTGPVTWTLLNAPNGVSIDPASGTLSIRNDLELQTSISVTATNRLQRPGIISSPLRVVNHLFISASAEFLQTAIPQNPVSFPVFQTVRNTGPIQWALSNANAYPTLTLEPVGDGRSSANLLIPYGTYLKESLTFEAINDLGRRSTVSSFLHVVPTPTILNPMHILTSVRDTDFEYRFQNISPQAARTPVTWRLSPANVFGVSFDNLSGLLRVRRGTFLENASFQVFASNEVAGVGAATFTMSIAQSPVLAPVGAQRASMTNQDFTLQVIQTATNTGPLLWGTCNYPGLSINSSGLLRVRQNFPIECNISVTAENGFQGFASTSFFLDVSQTPLIVSPPPEQTQGNTSTSPFTYQMTTSTLPQTTFWSIRMSNVLRPQPSALTIHPTSGLVTFQPYHFIDDRVTVTASNIKGDSSSVIFPLRVAQIPDLIAPSVLSASLVPNVPFTYRFTELSTGTGGTTWQISGVGGSPPPADLSFPQGSNLLRFTGFREVYSDVFILATNRLDYTAPPKTVTLRFERTPVVQNPGSIVASIETDLNYSFQTNGAPIQEWKIAPSSAFVSIHPTTGVLTFSSQRSTFGNFTVTASNSVGGWDAETFPVNVCRTPKLINPISITCNLPAGQPFQYSMRLDSDTPLIATGPLSWSVTPQVNGLSISSAGLLSVPASEFVQSRVTVTARNQAQGGDQVSFDLLVTHTPAVVNPRQLQFNMIRDPFSYTFQQTTQGTGPITWSLLTPVDGLSFAPEIARVTVPTGTYVNASTVQVQASNLTGATDVATFAVRVAQTPSFTLPPVIRGSTDDTDFQYPINQTAQGTGNLSWIIAPPIPSGVRITQSSNIIASTSNYVNQSIFVTVVNEFNGGLQVQANLLVAQTPVVIGPETNLTSNFEPTDRIAYSYQMEQRLPFAYTGPISWRANNMWGEPIEGLTISSAGILQVNHVSVNCNIQVTAVNAALGSNSVTFPVTVAQTPIVINPGYVFESMTSNFSYPMRVANFAACRPLSWDIQRADQPYDLGELSIDKQMGIISFMSNHRIDTDVTVVASNALGSFCNVSFRLHLLQTPIIEQPTLLSSNVEQENVVATFSMTQTAPSTGDVYWSVGGCNMQPLEDISIDPLTGVIEVAANKFVRSNIRVRASNVLGGFALTNPFPVIVARQPEITPVPLLSCNLQGSTPYQYQMAAALPSDVTGPLLWSVSSHPGLTIHPSSGLLTLSAAHCNIGPITVRASNIAGGSTSTGVDMAVSQLPVIRNPGTSHTRKSRRGIYHIDLEQTILRANPVTWSVSPILEGMSIAQVSPSQVRISIQENFAIRSNLTVEATNNNGASSSITFPVEVLETPRIDYLDNGIPNDFIANIFASGPSTVGFSTSLQQTVPSTSTSNLFWFVKLGDFQNSVNIPPSKGINITNEGVLTVAPAVFLENESIVIGVSNIYSVPSLEERTLFGAFLKVSPPASISGTFLSNIRSREIGVYWENPQYVNKVLIKDVLNPTSISYDVSVSPFILPNDIVAFNKSYRFEVTPLDVFNTAGATRTTTPFISLSQSVASVTVENVTTSNALVSWPPVSATTASYATLSWSNVTSDRFNVAQGDSQLVTSSNVTGLLPNRPYTFRVTTFNSANDPGIPTMSSEIVTLPRITSASVSSFTTSDILLRWNPDPSLQYYSNVLVTWEHDPSKTITSNVIGSDTLLISPIPETTPFRFTVTPYNRRGAAGRSLDVVIEPTVATTSPLVISDNAGFVNIFWGSGNYAYIIVTWSGTIDGNRTVNGTSLNIKLEGTNEDILFTVTPFNEFGKPGISRSVRLYKQDDMLQWFTV